MILSKEPTENDRSLKTLLFLSVSSSAEKEPRELGRHEQRLFGNKKGDLNKSIFQGIDWFTLTKIL